MSILELLKKSYIPSSHFSSFDERFGNGNLKLFPCFDTAYELKNTLPEKYHFCHKCGELFRVNQYYQCLDCYIVFMSESEANLVCSRKCLPVNAIEYCYQIYGFREPITLHPKLQNDEKYRAVYYTIFNDYKGFLLRKYKNGITQEIYYHERLNSEYSGSTYYLIDGTIAECTHWTEGLHVQMGHKYKPKANECILYLTIPQLINTINEIIEAYYSNQESLF